MGAVIFSDVHADAAALAAFLSCIKKPAFVDQFGTIDFIVNLGDMLHRGNHPKEVLKHVLSLAKEYRLVSIMGNHDHAFLNSLTVSGSDEMSIYRHEQLRGSPLLSIFDRMPMEWVHDDMLFVHGGPLELGRSTLHLKSWQRLGREAGEFFTGYHYTPEMAFVALRSRGLSHLCCGHQHTAVCCRNTAQGVKNFDLEYSPIKMVGGMIGSLDIVHVPLDLPTIMRVGACCGIHPEFAFTDFKTFTFIRMG